MMRLTKKVEIIIPKHDNDKRPIDSYHVTSKIYNITDSVGGCTITENKGLWMSKDENNNYNVMIDDNLNYEWYMMDFDDNIIDSFYAIVDVLIKRHKQEAISLKINGVLYLLFDADDVHTAFNAAMVA